jgi:ABC-type phosphate transport system substrate-binding protein
MTTKLSPGRLFLPLAICALLWCGMLADARAQISIIVAKTARLDSSAVNKSQLKEIFTGAKLKWPDGHKIQVVDQAETEMGKKFYDKVLGKSLNQVRKLWANLILSGQAAPPVKCASDKIVIKIVAGNPHAIGYVASGALDGSVKEIFRIE